MTRGALAVLCFLCGACANPIPTIDAYAPMQCEAADSSWGATAYDTVVGLNATSGLRLDNAYFSNQGMPYSPGNDPFPFAQRVVSYRGANGTVDTAKFELAIAGFGDTVVLCTLSVAPTGSWDSCVERSCSLSVAPGAVYRVLLRGVGVGGGESARLDWVRFERRPRTSIDKPATGENWVAGVQYGIEWSSYGAVDSVRIEYSLDDGATWHLIVQSTPSDGLFTWLVPDTVTAAARIALSSPATSQLLGPVSPRFPISRYKRNGLDTIPFTHADILSVRARVSVDSSLVVAPPFCRTTFTGVDLGSGARSLQVRVARPRPASCATLADCRLCTLLVSIRSHEGPPRRYYRIPVAPTEERAFSSAAISLDTLTAGVQDVWFENPYAKVMVPCQLEDSLYFEWFLFSASPVPVSGGHAGATVSAYQGAFGVLALRDGRLQLLLPDAVARSTSCLVRVLSLDGRLIYSAVSRSPTHVISPPAAALPAGAFVVEASSGTWRGSAVVSALR